MPHLSKFASKQLFRRKHLGCDIVASEAMKLPIDIEFSTSLIPSLQIRE